MMQRPHDALHLSPAEGDALIERREHNALSVEDRCVLVQVVRWLFGLFFVVQEAKLSLKRLRAVLFGHGAKAATGRASEASSPSSELADAGAGSDERRARGAEASRGASDTAALSKPTGGHRPGTGRLGADVYVGAERIACRHAELAVGQRCPVCGQGTLYALPPGREIRIDGHALLSALRYARQKLRCWACGPIFTAPLPDKAGEEKYSARARAVWAIGRYSLGLPLSRLQGYHAMRGVPVPEATQWDQIEQVGDCSYGVFESVETLAAQGELLHQDDPAVRLLSLSGANLTLRAHAAAMGFSRPKERTGM